MPDDSGYSCGVDCHQVQRSAKFGCSPALGEKRNRKMNAPQYCHAAYAAMKFVDGDARQMPIVTVWPQIEAG